MEQSRQNAGDQEYATIRVNERFVRKWTADDGQNAYYVRIPLETEVATVDGEALDASGWEWRESSMHYWENSKTYTKGHVKDDAVTIAKSVKDDAASEREGRFVEAARQKAKVTFGTIARGLEANREAYLAKREAPERQPVQDRTVDALERARQAVGRNAVR